MESSSSSTTTVINVKKEHLNRLGYNNLKHWLENSNHVYIGRHNSFVNVAESIWHNPFSAHIYGREECLVLFEKYVKSKPELMSKLANLKGKTLGCWCHPEPCHGHVLKKLIEGSEKNN